MMLDFGEHEDVVFEDAPLETVLCQIRFSPVYSLLDESGIAGFQEAVRRFYPILVTDRNAAVNLSSQGAEIRPAAPIWRFRNNDEAWDWQTSLAVDFISLETPSYPHFGEFLSRLDFILDALERTVKPGQAARIGLRKINRLKHPDVKGFGDWMALLNAEVLGLGGLAELPGVMRQSQTEILLDDDERGHLAIRHGVTEKQPLEYRIDMDYWTDTRRFEVRGGSDMSVLLQKYSDIETDFFHRILDDQMKQFLGPRPRTRMGETE